VAGLWPAAWHPFQLSSHANPAQGIPLEVAPCGQLLGEKGTTAASQKRKAQPGGRLGGKRSRPLLAQRFLGGGAGLGWAVSLAWPLRGCPRRLMRVGACRGPGAGWEHPYRQGGGDGASGSGGAGAHLGAGRCARGWGGL
jgi:hypothetical protein